MATDTGRKITDWLSTLPNPPEWALPDTFRTHKKRKRGASMDSSLENTPIAKRSNVQLRNTPAPPPSLFDRIPPLSPSETTAANTDNASSVTGSSSAFSSVTRSSSPTKRKRGEASPSRKTRYLEDLQSTDYPLRSCTIGRTSDLPESLRPLVIAMRRISKGQGIIPYESRTEEPWDQHFGDEDEDDADIVERDWEYVSRQSLKRQAVPPDVLHEVMEEASRNEALACSEPTWNSNVHSTLLTIAIRCSGLRGVVRWADVTSADISPSTLIPRLSEADRRARSKRVDYALSLELPITVEDTLRRKEIQVNPITLQGIKNNPIFACIETKRPGEGFEEARVQLATFAIAQVQNYRRIAPQLDLSKVPALPMILVQGHEWQLHLLRATADDAVYWHAVRFGSTSTLRGAYQIVAALNWLFRWGHEEFRYFIMNDILGDLLE